MATAQGFDLCCGICANTYSTDGPRKPRSLPCGHTLCTKCLGQHISHKVTGSTFRCPFCNQATHVECSGQEDHMTLGKRFPVNFVLADVIEQMESLQIQNTRDQLRTDWNNLKSTCQSVEHKLNHERRQLLQGLDLSVAQTAADINNAADKMIENFTAAVRADQESRLNELGALHETARGKVEEKFNTIKTCLNNPIKFLNSSESSLNDIKISESTIKSKRNEIKQLKTPLTDYLATPRVGGQETKITFNKSVNASENICINVGSINLTNEQTAIEMGSDSLDEQTVSKSVVGNPASDNMELVRVTDRQQSLDTQDEQSVRKSVVGNPASDNMELVKVIKTDMDTLYGIDVLDVLGSLKIIVASYLKSCIKCYNYEDGTQHCMYETSSGPRGLVTLRDGRVVVVVDNSKILFLTVNEEITVTKSVKTKKQYDEITQLTNSNLAVSVFGSDPGCVHILNLDCDVIQSISNLSPRPSCLTESHSGVVVVCESDQSVSCVMSHHDWVTSRDTSRLKGACGITCDRSGFIYVVDNHRNLVVQLGPSGEYLRDVITEQNGLSDPVAVCFHRDKLYITQDNGEIKIFTWS